MASRKPVPKLLRTRSKKLRSEMGEPELRFWSAVRAHRFRGFGFRRQVPIAGYIADFVCHDRCVIVEIDGASHATDLAGKADDVRTRRLNAEGFQVVRFWNHDVMENLDGVLQRLGEVLDALEPPSQPSPTRGEGAQKRTIR